MVRRIISQLFKLKDPGIIQEISGIQIIFHRLFRCIIPSGAIQPVFIGITHNRTDQVPVLVIFIFNYGLPIQPGVLLYKNPIGMRLF